jgi:hypothetical protein
VPVGGANVCPARRLTAGNAAVRAHGTEEEALRLYLARDRRDEEPDDHNRGTCCRGCRAICSFEVVLGFAVAHTRPVKSPTSGTVLKVYRESSLTLSVGALFRSGNDWAVYKVVKQRAVKATVKIAETSGSAALVESGVNEGDEVI